MGKSTVDILKTAILLERRGKAFYSTVARQTESEAVKKVFTMLAEEEDQHIEFLLEQFAEFEKNQKFAANKIAEPADDEEASLILSEQMKNEISAASYEAAAISAAIDFENRAIEVYQNRADEADDANEKELYQMLADWERTHHRLLHRLNEDLKEQIWNDNNFWPF
ncbi:MAG: ferritin family protein [Bacteroidales bacterium]|nr:ferritin family protein [Bacteroidales bacterium]